ncbi:MULTISPECIES: DUF4007 family protein [Streptomycetaceae]|uniref:DUF4007 family protein n=1 Tax=Streptomycetaceae TaxID=2062 RepID=UPI00288B42E1|nr:DUF4007 family protein [Streptomyces sp. ITFR-21]WNI20146.1 DUF4007 family protein [Streptomyces sp. ITFR-21]
MGTQEPLTDCLPAFGRHHGYPPRYGWLRKVHLALQDDPGTLRRPDATVILGVGSSMIPAMRFWSQAFGLASPSPARGLVPTARGRWLLDDEHGADPFLEEPASLYLLHWWLLSAAPCHVPSWRYLFGHSGLRSNSRKLLHAEITRAAHRAGWKTPAQSVVTSDITCLVSMYAPSAPDQPRERVEDALFNPFRSLHMLTSGPAPNDFGDRTHTVTLDRAAGQSCPAAILAYASLDYAARLAGPGPGTITVSRLASDSVGPGRLLLTDARGLLRALRSMSARHEGFAVTESAAGEDLLAYTAPPSTIAENILAGAFPQARGSQ